MPQIDYLAVLVAAVLAFAWGATYYMTLSKPWMKASRVDPSKGDKSAAPFVISFVALLVMGAVLSHIVAQVSPGAASVQTGLVTALWAWLGFMATTMAVNHRYEGYGWDLTIIDGGHWLGVALIMGAVIGWWG